MLTATLFGVSHLAWAIIASAVFLSGLVSLVVVFLGLCKSAAAEDRSLSKIRAAKPDLLDDWLAGDDLPFDFKVWKRPEAETHLEQPELRRAA